MKRLKYRPIYDPRLDKLFSKRIGKQVNPMRFGLTSLQVEELRQSGQWKLFLRTWQAKRGAYLSSNRLFCVVCGSKRQNGIKILGKRLCKRCCEDIRCRMKQN